MNSIIVVLGSDVKKGFPQMQKKITGVCVYSWCVTMCFILVELIHPVPISADQLQTKQEWCNACLGLMDVELTQLKYCHCPLHTQIWNPASATARRGESVEGPLCPLVLEP